MKTTANLKTAFLCSFILLMASVVFAQNEIRFGLRTGMNKAKFAENVGSLGYKNRTGLMFAALLDVPMGDLFSLHTEVQYSQKGYKIGNLNTNNGRANIESRLNYLEIPILAKFTFNKGGLISPFVIGGPSFGFGLGGTDKFCISADCRNTEVEFGDMGLNRFDLGISLGAGLLIADHYILDARYIYGLSNLNSLTGPDNRLKQRNRTLQLGLGFMF